MTLVASIVYFITACLFIISLRRMSSPVTARRGIVDAGIGMLAAFIVTAMLLFINDNPIPLSPNAILMIAALALGGSLAWISAQRVEMTAMPQMIALYNGMGGGAAACIAMLELLSASDHGPVATTLAILGALIGLVSFSGSLVAFAKLQGWMKGNFYLPGGNIINVAMLAGLLLLGAYMVQTGADPVWLAVFCAVALLYGVLMTVPIGGADMPVVISLYNALTGLAVGFEGFVLGNMALIVAGTVVGAAGTLLTQLMAKAMNRSLLSVLYTRFGDAAEGAGAGPDGDMKEIGATDVGILMAYADKVIIIPGYGMAVAQAQHKLWELAGLLEQGGVRVLFAIHPVAGRMPGHMNVLLAEASVPYEKLVDMEDVNADFASTDVVLVIGANDVVNPSARNDKSSPIYGMPILNADQAKNCVVIKRGKGRGFSGVENPLFFADNTRMFYGDGQKALTSLIQEVKALR